MKVTRCVLSWVFVVVVCAARVFGNSCGDRMDAMLVADQPVAWAGSSVISPANLADLPLETLVKEAEECRDRGHWQVIKIGFFASEHDRNRTLDPAKTSELKFADWLTRYEASRPEPMAMVLLIGDFIVARRLDVDANGKTETKFVTKGSIGDIKDIEVLDLAVEPHVPHTAGDPRGQITFFVKSSRGLSKDQATHEYGRSVSTALTEKVNFPGIRVLIRNDAWFVDDPAFPIRYRFETNPEKAEKPSAGGLKLSCNRNGSSFTCQVYGTPYLSIHVPRPAR